MPGLPPSPATVLVTGGAGYVGAPLCLRLVESGRSVRALDSLAHGQEDVAQLLEQSGVQVVRGDIRDQGIRRSALEGADAVVHLAAIVGDPACKRDPGLARAVNVDATRGLFGDMQALGVERLVFASTCSNYGRMADPNVLMAEDSPLAPVSLYAESKVEIEQDLLAGRWAPLVPTCLRFSTVYGVAPRMRFDLTVNEFTRDLWLGRRLEVFGEQFWRPYVHVQDAGRAVLAVLDAPLEATAGEVFNVGSTDENYTKLDLVTIIRETIPDGSVTYVHRDEDPRDYKVSFAKIAQRLGFAVSMRVRDGVGEIADALRRGLYPDPFASAYSN